MFATYGSAEKIHLTTDLNFDKNYLLNSNFDKKILRYICLFAKFINTNLSDLQRPEQPETNNYFAFNRLQKVPTPIRFFVCLCQRPLSYIHFTFMLLN